MAGETGNRTPIVMTANRTPDSGVCSISPSDLVGYVGNLINRVDELEQKVAELEAGNVEVNQLSDLAQQVGWVTGVTYLGIPGWTQTEYGTLMPPAGVSLSTLGFTMSDGNTYPFVVMDEDGVLQFGFTDTGAVGGTYGVIGQIYLFAGADTITYSTTPSTQRYFKNFSSIASDNLVSQNVSTGKLTFASTGYYLLTYVISVAYPAAAGVDRMFDHGFSDGGGVWLSGLFQTEEVTGQTGEYNFAGSYVHRVASVSTDYVYLTVADNGTAAGTRTCDNPQLAIVRLKGL